MYYFCLNSRWWNRTSQEDRLPSPVRKWRMQEMNMATNKDMKSFNLKLRMLHQLLELMCDSILVFPFQEMTMVKRKHTNACQFANIVRCQSATIREIKYEKPFGSSPPKKLQSHKPTVSKKLRPGQRTLKEAFGAPLPCNSLQEITRCICIYIAKDLRLLSLIDNGVFQRLVNMLEP